MSWLLRSLRLLPPAEVTITAVISRESSLNLTPLDPLGTWFEAFDERSLPVTWACVRPDTCLPLGPQLAQSTVSHEFAYNVVSDSLASSLPLLEAHAAAARTAQVPLRAMIRAGGKVHPSLLARLGVSAVIQLDASHQRFQMGGLRSYGWNQWEVLVSDFVPSRFSLTEATQMMARLYVAKRDQAALNLLWDLGRIDRSPHPPVLRFLDCLADLVRRDQVKVTTIGNQAATATQKTQSCAA